MKAFEKYWVDTTAKKGEGCTIDENICGKVKSCAPCKELQKVGFRAALEWTLKTAKELEEQDAPIFMEDVIKQELEQD